MLYVYWVENDDLKITLILQCFMFIGWKMMNVHWVENDECSLGGKWWFENNWRDLNATDSIQKKYG